MWRVDPTGEFSFSDATDPNQLVMFADPDFTALRRQISRRFSNREATVAEVEEFVFGRDGLPRDTLQETGAGGNGAEFAPRANFP